MEAGRLCMSKAGRKYAQIDNKALVVTWACERLNTYFLGWHFNIETDYKPFVPLLSTKRLDDLPP